ncbi:MAG: N-acetylmuramoyl-L-alanine amidase [Pseudomonadota bacterium]
MTDPDLVVLHYTAMTGGPEPALKRLCDPATEVSCHYLIGERGQTFRLVPEDRRAWHAGVGRWGDCMDVNSRSIGIELSNDAESPFPAPQMDSLEKLLVDIMSRRPAITPERVIGHSDVAPGRKIDPGPRFDWKRLARGGSAVWPDAHGSAAPDIDLFRDLAWRAGYRADVKGDTLLSAIRLRFRPWATGPLDGDDMDIIGDVAERFPVDRPSAVA